MKANSAGTTTFGWYERRTEDNTALFDFDVVDKLLQDKTFLGES